MKRNKKELETILDETLHNMSNEPLETRAIDDAASRVWARIAADHNPASVMTPAAERIDCCADFQTLIPSYLRRDLSPARTMLLEDHTQECIPCRKALKEARTGRVAATRAAMKPARASQTNFTAWRWAMAASVVVAVVVGGLFYSNRMPSGGALAATVESTTGALYKVTDAGTLAMAVGEEIGKGVHVRTAKDSGAVVRLNDGSLVEMRERSEFSVSENGQGLTLHLDRGDVIVEAAKQGAKHLYVATPDSLVSVKGTIFAVGSGTKGSRVSVVEGEVHVNHSGADKVLKPGDQTVTGASLVPVSVAADVAWSRNAARYAKMATELAALRRDIAQQVPHPGVRYSTRFLDLAPEGTVLYAALPNLATTLGESHRIMQERIAQNPALSQWMKEQETSSAHGPGLNQTMARVREFGEYLGDEIVVTAGTNAQGNPDAFLVLGELKNAQGFRPFVEKQINDLKNVDKGAPNVRIIDDPNAVAAPAATAQTTTAATSEKKTVAKKIAGNRVNKDELYIWIHNDFFAASPKIESLRGLQATMSAPGTNRFIGTPFYARIADVYKEGAGLIVAADLEKVIAQATSNAAKQPDGQKQLELFKQAGLFNLKHFVVEQKEVKAKTQSRAVLTFNEPRRGIASWLAAPGPMGALKFISPDAHVATAFVVKEPTLLVDDLLGFMETASPDLRKRLRELETQNGLDIKRDFAAPLGGEYAFAIDGPVLPTPSWKMIVEVYDQKHLQQTFESVVGKLNAWAAQHGQKGLTLEQAGNIYTLRSADFGLEVHYTFAEGYLIAAPTSALLTRALQYRESGVSLMTSPKFIAALPEDGNTNFSAVFYHNLAALLQPLAGAVGERAKSLGEEQQKAIAAFAANSQPTLAYAYAQGDRITLAANTEGGPFGLSPGSLLGLPNAFAMQHIMMEAMDEKKGGTPDKK
jgi:hypothetical protein